MSQSEKQIVESIRAQYSERNTTKLDELKALHKAVSRPAKIFAYIFGVLGALILGIGMCLAMPKVVEGYMILGIAVGIVGIIMVSVNYSVYKAILCSRKSKYSKVIFELSEEILDSNK